jgi:hypothetical protein
VLPVSALPLVESAVSPMEPAVSPVMAMPTPEQWLVERELEQAVPQAARAAPS